MHQTYFELFLLFYLKQNVNDFMSNILVLWAVFDRLPEDYEHYCVI